MSHRLSWIVGIALVTVTQAAPVSAQVFTVGVQQPHVAATAGRVAYVLAGRLWIADLALGQGQLLATSGDRVASPVLSPDGQTLVYLAWRDRYHTATLMRRTLPAGQPVEVLRPID